MPTTRIEPAQRADAPRLTHIAMAAKRHWGYSDELMRMWSADLTVTAETIDKFAVYVARRDGVAAGFYALSQEGAEIELEHMWVAPEAMGAGIGALLFTHALAASRALGGSRLLIASDPHAEGFYLRMGAQRVGEVASTPAGRSLPLLRVALTGHVADE